MTENEDLNLPRIYIALRTDWFVSKKRKRPFVAVTKKGKYSI